MEQRKNLFLIFKEAVNNAVKYSGTEKLQVELVQGGKELTLTVKDQGRGFDPDTVPKGNGLNNMKTRANELNAAFHILTGEAGGSIVLLAMPLSSA
ncbi:Sensor protein VraS [compost metagenome]